MWILALLFYLGDPGVRFVRPQGEVFAGRTDVELSVDGVAADDLVGVELFVNGLSVYYGEEAPFLTTVNLADFAEGELALRAIAYVFDGDDLVGEIKGKNVSTYYDEEVQLVCVPVLIDGERATSQSLAKSDFRVLEDGIPQPLTRAYTVEAPLYVVAVVDLSGSMKVKLPMVKRGLYSFYDHLSDQDSIMIMGFTERVFQVSDFETDREQLRRRTLRLEAGGDTNLYGALWSGIRAAANVQGRRAVMIFTDGQQELHPDAEDILAKSLDQCVLLAQEEGIPVYTMGVGAHIAPEVLQAIADETGGQSFILKNRSSITDAFESLGKRLGSQYLLGYYSESRRMGWHDIQVDCPGHPGLVLRHPNRLYFR